MTYLTSGSGSWGWSCAPGSLTEHRRIETEQAQDLTQLVPLLETLMNGSSGLKKITGE